jgi:hypothetical protein
MVRAPTGFRFSCDRAGAGFRGVGL